MRADGVDRSQVRAAGELFVGRDHGGQSELKRCAARGIADSPQAASVRFNNGAADPESHARAVGLGGKERIKELVRLLRGQIHAGLASHDGKG